MSEPKEAILGRVRGALGSARKPDAREAEYAAVVREYRTTSDLDREALLALFVERLHDYGALVHACSAAEIAGTGTPCRRSWSAARSAGRRSTSTGTAAASSA